MWQETSIRSEQAHTARESRSVRAQTAPRAGLAGGPTSLPIPAPAAGLVCAGLCPSGPFGVSGPRENGPEIPSSHSETTSEGDAEAGCAPSSPWVNPSHRPGPLYHSTASIAICASQHRPVPSIALRCLSQPPLSCTSQPASPCLCQPASL